jgi:tetratricopeptide (TPR) repeat protein
MYAFDIDGARRSFRMAARRDTSCAMCYWGEAWGWGPYLNGPMAKDSWGPAYGAVQRASRLIRQGGTDVERALIDAMSLRYAATYDSSSRVRLDSAYANAMARVAATFPTDLDVAALHGEALMLLEPRRGSWDIGKPAVRRIHEVLQKALVQDIRHPGVCHLYIHATESTVEPGKAEECANYLGSAFPGASHINHMPSHTFNRIGRWADAVRANLEAWHSDQRAAAGEGFAIYPSHNLHMLLFAASMDGQGAIAIQAARDYAKIVSGGAFYQALTLLRFGRFGEVLELEDVPEHPIYRGLWLFARGYAHLRVGDPDNARAYLERVDRTARITPDSVNFRGHRARELLGIAGEILRGELARHERRLNDAISAFERAVALEDSLRYDEPEPLNFTARHWLGAALLEAGRPADAERVYRADLTRHPKNGWSLFGLEQALRSQGRSGDADKTRQEFQAAWARSDVWIGASRF